jgi:hypothetical protein
MTAQQITLAGAASLFGVHPRTIVRALSGEHNTYWTEDINEDPVPLTKLAASYGVSVREMVQLIEGRDKLLKPDEAAEVLGIRPRTFRDRAKAGTYRKVSNGGIVRYLRSQIIEDKIARE